MGWCWSWSIPNDHWIRGILTFLGGRFLLRSTPFSLWLWVLGLLLLSLGRRLLLLLRDLCLQRWCLRLLWWHLLLQLRNPSHVHLNLRRHCLRSILHRLRHLRLLSRRKLLLSSLHLLQK